MDGCHARKRAGIYEWDLCIVYTGFYIPACECPPVYKRRAADSWGWNVAFDDDKPYSDTAGFFRFSQIQSVWDPRDHGAGVGEYRADHCKFVVGVIYEDAGIGFWSDRLFEKDDRRREHGKLVWEYGANEHTGRAGKYQERTRTGGSGRRGTGSSRREVE